MGRKQRENWRFAAQAGLFAASMFMPPMAAYFTIVTGNVLITALFPPRMAKEEKTSPSYAWKHTANSTASEDTPMSIVYGKARVKPIIKSRFITMEGDKQFLNTLYGFTGHRIDEISNTVAPRWRWLGRDVSHHFYDTGDVVRTPAADATYGDEPGKTYRCKRFHYAAGIENIGEGYPGSGIDYYNTDYWEVWHGTAAITDILIDGMPIENFITANSEDVRYETRPGLSEQTVIEGFENAYSNLPQSITLNENWITIQTASEVVQNIEVTLYFPNGLYRIDAFGAMEKRYKSIYIQYREIGTDDWNSFQYRMKHNDADSPIFSGTGIQVGMSSPSSTYRVYRAKVDGTYLDTGKPYEIRISTSIPSTDERVQDTLQIINVATISYAQPDADGELRGFTYPGEALLGLKILATGQLSGDIETTGVVERSTVPVWVEDESRWDTTAAADAHGWAVYDILANGHPSHPAYPDIDADSSTIQPIYGCGIPRTRLDYASFRDWVVFANGNDNPNTAAIEGLGRKLNIVFDTFTTAWDAILRICQEGRGIIFPIGSKFYALVDKAITDVVVEGTTDKDVTQLFSMGNINLESFKQQWVDKSKKANAIEIVFFDEDNNYDRTQFVIRTSDWDTMTELNNPLQLVLQGTTEYSQAFAQGIYLMNCNELLNHVVVLESDIESLQSQVGDVIRIQHDSMMGEGGKVVGYDSPTGIVTLDKEITIVPGTDYEFIIQLSDGSLRMKTVTGGSNTSTINFGASVVWGAANPTKYDSWAFGEVGASSKLFRIIDITIAGNYGRRITCLEYDARIYQLDLASTDTAAQTAEKEAEGTTAPAGETSNWNVGKIAADLGRVSRTTFNTASTIQLEEVISRNRATGEYESSIVASWNIEEGENWGEWDVSLRDVDATDLGWQGDWSSNSPYDIYDKVYRDGLAFISTENTNTKTPILIEG